MSARTLWNWKRRPGGGDRAPGRPPRHDARARWSALRAVAREWRRQGGGTVGWPRICAALGARVPRRLVQECLHAIKARARRRERERRARTRVHVEIQGRDVVWSVDATHLGRESAGAPIQGRVVRDAATTALPAIGVGPPARGEEVVAQLEAACGEREGAPLVLSRDNGPEYASRAVARWCREHRVVVLRNLPHTPQHNAWVEHANGELKELLAPALWTASPTDANCYLTALREAAGRLERCRLRVSRGGRTAAELDALLPRGDHLVDRSAFYEAACSQVALAVNGLKGARARRRAEREAIFGVMEHFGLIIRTRGGAPIAARDLESVS